MARNMNQDNLHAPDGGFKLLLNQSLIVKGSISVAEGQGLEVKISVSSSRKNLLEGGLLPRLPGRLLQLWWELKCRAEGYHSRCR